MYEIRKGIPVPARKGYKERDPESFQGQLRRMEVGDSMIVDDKPRGGINSSCCQVRHDEGFKFKIRKIEGENTYGIWRVG